MTRSFYLPSLPPSSVLPTRSTPSVLFYPDTLAIIVFPHRLLLVSSFHPYIIFVARSHLYESLVHFRRGDPGLFKEAMARILSTHAICTLYQQFFALHSRVFKKIHLPWKFLDIVIDEVHSKRRTFSDKSVDVVSNSDRWFRRGKKKRKRKPIAGHRENFVIVRNWPKPRSQFPFRHGNRHLCQANHDNGSLLPAI